MFCRQIDFLSELAVLEGSFTGIGYWYIGLTDLGENFYMTASYFIVMIGREGDWAWMHDKSNLEEDDWNINRPNNRSRNSDDCVVMVLKNNEVWWEDHRYRALFPVLYDYYDF